MTSGISFSPLGQQGGQQDASQMQRPAGAAVQDAIRLLSLKMPSNLGPAATSPLFSGTQTALGPQLGNVLADNWLQGLYGPGRQKVQPVPLVNSAGDSNPAGLFMSLLQQMGVPSVTQQPAPSGVQARVHRGGLPPDALLGGISGAGDQGATDAQGGTYTMPAQRSATPVTGAPINGGFGGLDFQSF